MRDREFSFLRGTLGYRTCDGDSRVGMSCLAGSIAPSVPLKLGLGSLDWDHLP